MEVKFNKGKGNFKEAKDKIKELLKSLKKEESPEELKKLREQFKETLDKADPLVIAIAEGELVQEGYSLDDIASACDIHLELFKDQIENPDLNVPEDHPIHRFQEDHREILALMNRFYDIVKSIKDKNKYEDISEEYKEMKDIADKLMEAENHNIRQENTLFPILERHGVEEAPKIMWNEHTVMKDDKKKILRVLDKFGTMDYNDFVSELQGTIVLLIETFANHTRKEENILYPASLETFTDEEWADVKEECDNLGYF